jgi:large subunit ribosomal protein L13e
MVRHNNVIPNQHFHKKWERRVRTWFDQPAQKKARATKRKAKAAAISPRPVDGPLKPVVRCPTKRYNGKIKFGRGFTLEELKEAGISAAFAKTIGISVDHRRTNKSTESLTLNVARLNEYKARLILFPRKGAQTKKGDSSKEECAEATQLKVPIIPLPKVSADAVTLAPLTDDMKVFRPHSTLRIAYHGSKLVGIRSKKAAAAKTDGPKKDDAAGDD